MDNSSTYPRSICYVTPTLFIVLCFFFFQRVTRTNKGANKPLCRAGLGLIFVQSKLVYDLISDWFNASASSELVWNKILTDILNYQILYLYFLNFII